MVQGPCITLPLQLSVSKPYTYYNYCCVVGVGALVVSCVVGVGDTVVSCVVGVSVSFVFCVVGVSVCTVDDSVQNIIVQMC